MKYIQFRILLCAVIFLLPGVLSAQNSHTNGMIQSVQDSVANNTGDNLSVQTAYRKEKKENLLGGISYVNMPQILNKNYILNGLDGMQAFVGGFNGHIWGMGNYLVLVDGVPRSANSVVPSAIKQITFLKGIAATVLYGSHAANGVIYITTKRGGDHKLQIDGRVDAGMYVPKSYPQYLGSAQYMTLYNEARQNDGLQPLYTPSTIYNYASGKDPYRYPNLNYYSNNYLKSFYNRYDGNLGISGGNQSARYYTNINFGTAGSLLNFGNAKNDGNNHLSIRGNVNLNVNKYLSGTVEAAAIYDNQNGVNVLDQSGNPSNYWSEAATLRPNLFAPLIPISNFVNNSAMQQIVQNSNHVIGGKYLLGGTQLYPTNPIADIYAGGTNQVVNRQFQFNTGINANLVKVLKGLSFHTMFGVDYQTAYEESYNNAYAVFDPSWVAYNGKDQISSLSTYGKDSKTGVQNINNSSYEQTIAYSGQFNYNHTINGDQYISAMLIAAGYQQTQTGVYQKTNNVNLGLQLSYNYQHKYYAEFDGAIPQSAKLPPGKRIAFSPTFTLGWRISKAKFMSDVSAINNLMLYLSGGIMNTDLSIPGYYLYQSEYTQANGEYFSWRDGALRRGTDSRRGPNPNLTYAKRKEIDAGINASFFNNALNLNGSFFYNRMTGNVIQSSVLYPSYFTTGYPNSSFVPYINYNADQREGFDLTVNFNKKIGGIDWTLGLAGTYFNSKAVKRAEVHQYGYEYTQGKPLDAIWGLQSEGFFQSQQDIANSPKQSFGQVQPGDIKYKDQNGDGVINSQDVVYLGKAGWNGAPLTYGINLTARWKNLTFFALGTGQHGAYGMKNSSYYWVSGSEKYSAAVLNRWTEQTKNTATYPRLTTLSGSNNFRSSDFWMYSTDRFDLQEVQVTYNLPKRILRGWFIRNMEIYVKGSNLLTIAPNRKVMELNIGGSPQTRFYNVGIKAYF